ncbi:glycoside hydrolase family 15 protein [Flavobacteriales bacterium]|jgi:GH15 family glucan-1,4-alpha-glucosidase|nr:glycoside hydrolase family 15 protein [Flavobacteriales bacterium]|tara:strand:- start:1915 stop:3687 length:1773 start_codon:yes stop_codon:yes gene_type:complete
MIEDKGLNYGIIGNCKSSALINADSSIDWCCLPQFDSSAVFCKIIDEKIGGSFKIEVDKSYTITQHYLNNTAILKTNFRNNENEFEVLDFMTRFKLDDKNFYNPPELQRMIRPIRGLPKIKVLYNPTLEYANGKTKTYKKEDFIVSVFEEASYETLFLYTDIEKNKILENKEFELAEPVYLNLSYNEKIDVPNLEKSNLELEKTKEYWINWCKKGPKYKLYNDEVKRSAITLKLLTFEKTGAVLAAATTSIPETIGEVRNWDYRFCWIRDASMVIKIIAKLGHERIVKNFIDFIVNLIPNKNEKLQIMYGIDGQKILTEKKLDHLSGYKNSKPVRIGNAAYIQKQNDIYGILVDVIHFQIEKFKEENYKYEQLWSIVKSVVWVVEKNWKKPDKGIWEFRNEDQHFTFSKLLCWVAIDRAIKISNLIKKGRKTDRWIPLRDEIKNDILSNAWNPKIKAFSQSYGSDFLDASVLLMESYGFIESKDPKYIDTVKAIEKELLYDGLLFRYKNNDDFGEPKSSFTVCTFWYINSLFKIGEESKAKRLFDQLLSNSNHLGLFSEDLDFKTKKMLGNFPQAYSHLALIETAMNFNP